MVSTTLFLFGFAALNFANCPATALRDTGSPDIRGLMDFEWSVEPADGFPSIVFNQASEGKEVEFRYDYTGNLGDTGSYFKYLSFSVLSSDCDRSSPVDPTVMDLQEVNGQSIERFASLDQNKMVDLYLDINQATISSSDYYTESENGLSAEIAFCVRVAYLYDEDNDPNTPDEGIFFHEMVLTISVDLTANFTLTALSIDRSGAAEASADLKCEAQAYFCTDDRQPIPAPLLSQGDVLQFCVEIAKEDAHLFFIRDIMETDLEQDNNGNQVYRETGDEHDDIIVNYESNFLTSKSCIAGICQVKTQLASKYFTDRLPNPLTIIGSALCALGSAPDGETGYNIPIGGVPTETNTPTAPVMEAVTTSTEPTTTIVPTTTTENITTTEATTTQGTTQAITAQATTTQATTASTTTTPGTTTTSTIEACIPSASKCCQDSDCTNPYGAICDRDTGYCACDSTRCESAVSLGGDKICMSTCDCPEDCNSSTGTCDGAPELNCATCDDSDECVDGYTCDGRYCVEAGKCTSRKQALCDNAYFEITGSPDQRAKCCPDTSGCVSSTLKLGWNSVCSTTCGTSCMGVIQGDKNYPSVLCAADNTPFAAFLGLEMCYEDVVKPHCEVTAISDTGDEKCKDYHSGENAGCISPTYTVCCAAGHESSLNCDPNFVVPDEIPQ